MRNFLTHVLCLFCLILCSCGSSNKRTSNSLSSTSSGAVSDDKAKNADVPRVLQPDSAPKNPKGCCLSGSGDYAAVSAVLFGALTAIGTVMSSDDQTRDDVRGECFYGDPQFPAGAGQCIGVTIRLLDSEGKPTVETLTGQTGSFRFYIPAGKKYQIQAEDRKGRTSSLKTKVGRGDFVSIYIQP